jgi:hypothetical protein
MKSTDKVLIGIVGGIILLVGITLVIILTKPEPTYQPDDTPEGAAYNYLLALQKEDYEKAYSYLSPTIFGYPTSVNEFTEDVLNNSWMFRLNRETTISIKSTSINGAIATVTVLESSFSGGDLFSSGQSTSNFNMKLILRDDKWRILDSRYYFSNCWSQSDGCN